MTETGSPIDLSELDLTLLWGPKGWQPNQAPTPDPAAILDTITEVVSATKLEDQLARLIPKGRSAILPTADQLLAGVSKILIEVLQAVYTGVVQSTILTTDHNSEQDMVRAEVADLQDKLEELQAKLDDSDGEVEEGARKRPRKDASSASPKGKVKPFTPLEQAIAERHEGFGFHIPSWKRCKWTSNSTRAVEATYTSILAKLSGGEKITTRVMVDDVAGMMDAWINRTPTDADVEKVRLKVERLYCRFRSLNAPAGSAAAVASAVEKTFDESLLDSRFRAAADAAGKLELYQMAGPMAGMAGEGLKGAGSLWKSSLDRGGSPNARWPKGGKPPPRGGGKNPKGGRGGKGDDTEESTNPDLVCFKCRQKGHPKRLCPN